MILFCCEIAWYFCFLFMVLNNATRQYHKSQLRLISHLIDMYIIQYSCDQLRAIYVSYVSQIMSNIQQITNCEYINFLRWSISYVISDICFIIYTLYTYNIVVKLEEQFNSAIFPVNGEHSTNHPLCIFSFTSVDYCIALFTFVLISSFVAFKLQLNWHNTRFDKATYEICYWWTKEHSHLNCILYADSLCQGSISLISTQVQRRTNHQ
jgi:hypothetical protein